MAVAALPLAVTASRPVAVAASRPVVVGAVAVAARTPLSPSPSSSPPLRPSSLPPSLPFSSPPLSSPPTSSFSYAENQLDDCRNKLPRRKWLILSWKVGPGIWEKENLYAISCPLCLCGENSGSVRSHPLPDQHWRSPAPRRTSDQRRDRRCSASARMWPGPVPQQLPTIVAPTAIQAQACSR